MEDLAQFSCLLSAFGIGVWYWDSLENQIHWDKGMVTLFGVEAESIVHSHDSWLQILHPDDRHRCGEEYSNFLQGNAAWETRFRLVKSDGTTRYIWATGRVLKSKDGRPQTICVLNFDVTRTAELEAQSIATSTKVAHLLEAIGVGIWESDLVRHQLHLDDTMYKLYGLKREDCPDGFEANKKAIHAEDRDQILNGTMQRLIAGDNRFDGEFRVIHPDGQIRSLATKMLTERNELGTPLRMSGANYDITELRTAEHQLRQIMAAIHKAAIVVKTDKHGLIIEANDKFCELSGYDRHEVIGKTHRLVNSGRHPAKFFKGLWSQISAGKTWTGEICNRSKNGSEYWVQTVITPLRDTNGAIHEYLAVRFDVTDIKAAQSALSMGRDQLLEAQRVGAVGSFAKDFVHGIDEISEEGRRIFGYQADEQSQFTERWQRIHPEDRHLIKVSEDDPCPKSHLQEQECRIIHPDGKIIYAFIRMQCQQDEHGRTSLVQGTIQDITQRKILEIQLSKAKETFQTILETVGIGIGMASFGGDLIKLNPEGLRILGYSSLEDAQQAGIRSFFQNETDQRILRNSLEENASINSSELMLKRKDGTGFWGSINARTKTEPDGSQFAIFTLTDVTHQKEVESRLLQAEKMASLGEMAAGVAHEINTPLAIILGKMNRIERLLTADEHSHILEDATIIKDTVMRISKIIKGLHTFARSGEADPFFTTRISDIVNHTLDLCQERFRAINIRLEISNIPDFCMICRETQIVQILINLLNNSFYAVQDLSEKWIKLEVAVIGTSEVNFSVSDSGVGISPEIAEKIMLPFFTTKPVGKGTGLGLSISLGIAADHGGTLLLDRESKRTRFVLKLPINPQSASRESFA